MDAEPHRALVFAQQKSTLDLIERLVFKKHLPSLQFLRLDGKVEQRERFDIAQKFNIYDFVIKKFIIKKYRNLVKFLPHLTRIDVTHMGMVAKNDDEDTVKNMYQLYHGPCRLDRFLRISSYR